MKRCPTGMFSEIKYDGERIQIHKNGDKYDFYSRNLKVFNKSKVYLLDNVRFTLGVAWGFSAIYSEDYYSTFAHPGR